MRMIYITILMAAASVPAAVLPAVAQSNSCPLQPTSVKNVASQIAVSVQNTSGKQIASYRLGLTLHEINGRAHPFPEEFTDNVQLPANVRRTAIWNSRFAHQLALPLAQVYLLQVTFADGTDWMDDGSRSCTVTSEQE